MPAADILLVHLLPADGVPVARAGELAAAAADVVVTRVGAVAASLAGTRAAIEALFQTRLRETPGGDIEWHPVIPAAWAGVVAEVALAPTVEFDV